MSTVLLSLTHIASDHTVVNNEYPKTVSVDPAHKKIFVPEHKRFVLGCVGNFHPKDIDRDEVYDAVEALFATALRGMLASGKDGHNFKDRSDAETLFCQTFDTGPNTLLVTRHFRFMFYCKTEGGPLSCATVGDMVGMGSGGWIGQGMLLGGMDIHDVWEPLNRRDATTSVEHTIFNLSELVDTLEKDEGSDA